MQTRASVGLNCGKLINMKRTLRLASVVCVVSFGIGVSSAHAQTRSGSVSDSPVESSRATAGGSGADSLVKSATSKFFIGGEFEGNGIVEGIPGTGSTTTESGTGVGLVVGYGFTPVWSLYANL